MRLSGAEPADSLAAGARQGPGDALAARRTTGQRVLAPLEPRAQLLHNPHQWFPLKPVAQDETCLLTPSAVSPTRTGCDAREGPSVLWGTRWSARAAALISTCTDGFIYLPARCGCRITGVGEGHAGHPLPAPPQHRQHITGGGQWHGISRELSWTCLVRGKLPGGTASWPEIHSSTPKLLTLSSLLCLTVNVSHRPAAKPLPCLRHVGLYTFRRFRGNFNLQVLTLQTAHILLSLFFFYP